jgi:hypothetical protein
MIINDDTSNDDIRSYNAIFISEGWIGAEDIGCFKFLDYAVNIIWGVAHQQCEKIGGFLAEPRTSK